MYGLPDIHTRVECEDCLHWAREDVLRCLDDLATMGRTFQREYALDRAEARVEYLVELRDCLLE